jgi:hypothetical protein
MSAGNVPYYGIKIWVIRLQSNSGVAMLPQKVIKPVIIFILTCEDVLTNCLQHSPPWEANNHSANQEISCHLWNLKVYYCVHKEPAIRHKLSFWLKYKLSQKETNITQTCTQKSIPRISVEYYTYNFHITKQKGLPKWNVRKKPKHKFFFHS